MFVVTTSHKPTRQLTFGARKLADTYNLPFVSRRRLSDFKRSHRVEGVYVLEKSGRLVLYVRGERLFFHPSVAKIRYLNIKKGLVDYLIKALEPEGDEIVFDATFGLGSEALLMAAFLREGKVVGTEASVHIYRIVSYGLKHYRDEEEWVNEAMKRVEVVHADFREYLSKVPDGSFDVVYCDPMFKKPRFESSSMNPLRPVAIYDSVDTEDLEEFLRVARKKVIIKSHMEDGLLDRLGIKEVMGSSRSGVIYGVVRKE